MKFIKKAPKTTSIYRKNSGYWKAYGTGARLFDASGMLMLRIDYSSTDDLYIFSYDFRTYYYDTLEQAKEGAESALNYSTSEVHMKGESS